MTRTTGVRAQVAQHGFVPCENHSREIVTGNNTVANLIKDRLCPLEFGHHVMYDPYITMMVKHFASAMMYGIPLEIAVSALKFTHEHAGEKVMKECEDAYKKYERERSDSTTDAAGLSSS